MFCPRCGKQLGGTEKFCPNCGFDLALPSSTAATNAEAAATPQKPLAPRVPAQPVPGPMPTSKTVAPAELVTLTAALLVGIAAFLPEDLGIGIQHLGVGHLARAANLPEFPGSHEVGGNYRGEVSRRGRSS